MKSHHADIIIIIINNRWSLSQCGESRLPVFRILPTDKSQDEHCNIEQLLITTKWITQVTCFTIQYSTGICKAKECKALGDIVASGMNKSSNPCNDFWEYACGNWISTTPIPPGEAVWNRFKLLFKAVKEKMRGILESKELPGDYEMVNKAKRWYRSCMNRGQRETVGIQGLQSILDATGGWPITMTDREWAVKNVSWQQVDLYYGSLRGQYAFYSIDSGKDYFNLLKYKIMLTRAQLPLAYKLPIERKKFDDKDREAYSRLIRSVVQSFIDARRTKISTDKMLKDVNDIVNFEIKLSKIQLGRLYQYSTVEYVSSHYSYYFDRSTTARVNFADYINQYYDFGNMRISPKEFINVYYDYLNSLGSLFENTPMKTLVNYVHWHFVSDVFDWTTTKMSSFLKDFKRTQYGIKGSKPAWEECVDAMPMHHAIAPEFVRKYFPERIGTTVLNLLTSLKSAMEGEIKKADWTNARSKELLINKLRNIVELIGYPVWYADNNYLTTAYSGLDITSNYFENNMNWSKYIVAGRAQMLRSVDTRDQWYGSPITVNAFYRIFLNNINLPAALFQPPFFSPDLPDLVNYAVIGSIAGHEMSHAFDALGIRYDENGKAGRLAFNFMREYVQNVKCFDNQYKKYRTNKPAAVSTLNEDIADNEGARVAYEAYESQRRGSEPSVPGLEEYSSEQAFFILFSSIWCSKATPEFLNKKQMDEEDVHSQPRLRVIGTLSNMKEFSEAFKCPKGTTMNPNDKCNLWMRNQV